MLKRFAALLAIAFAIAAPAFAQQPEEQRGKPALVSERAAVVPGDQFLAAFKLDIAEGWHVYWKNAGDSGLPPDVLWKAPVGATVGEPLWPAPHAIRLATLMNYGFEKKLILPVQVTVPKTLKAGDTFKLDVEAAWLICADICIPEPPGGEPAKLSISLPVEAALRTDAASSREIAETLTHVPQPSTGASTVAHKEKTFVVGVADADIAAVAAEAVDIRWFPDGHEILHPAKQEWKRGPSGVSVTLQASDFAKAGDQPLSGVIVTEAKDGSHQAWSVAAQPGEIATGLADATVKTGGGSAGGASASGSGGGQVASLGGVALLSVLGFAFLGGLVLNLMPCVLPVLSIKAAGLVHTAHDPKESRAHGLAYLGGVLLCFAVFAGILVALRAAGEQAGLGFQLQYAPVTAAFSLLIFAVGLNLLGVFEIGTSLMGVGNNLASKSGTSGAFFTGLLAAFVGAPCIGPFMAAPVGLALEQPAPIVVLVFLVVGAGLAAPFVALSFTPALARMLPKPGKWMETLRQVLAFPMFLAALWLVWVLAGQTGPDGVIIVLGGALALTFGIWLARKVGGGVPGRVVAVAVILAAFIWPTVQSAYMKPAEAGTTSLAAEAGAEPWSPELVARYQGEGRVVFVDFTARWCATCQVNKTVAIQSAQAKKAFADNNVAFLVGDWTNRDSVIADELGKHGRAGVPLYLVYPASGGEPQVLPQILSPGLVAKAVRQAASGQAAEINSKTGDRT